MNNAKILIVIQIMKHVSRGMTGLIRAMEKHFSIEELRPLFEAQMFIGKMLQNFRSKLGKESIA